MSRIGPKLTLDATCYECIYKRSERYTAQGNSGADVYCVHPSSLVDGKQRHVGDTTWRTPVWCPELPKAKAEFKID